MSPAPEPFYFGAPTPALFGWHHAPQGPAQPIAVLLVSAVGFEHVRAYRVFRRLAEMLADAGFHALRFDFRGLGNSLGPSSPEHLQPWRDDVHAAIDELKVRAGVAHVAIVGLRLGATIALDTAFDRGDVAAFALWSPCPSGRGFLREQALASRLAAPGDKPADGVDILGFAPSEALTVELGALSLTTLRGAPSAPVLIVGSSTAPTEESLAEALAKLGASVRFEHLPGTSPVLPNGEGSDGPEPALRALVGWLETAHFNGRSGEFSQPRGTSVAVPTTLREAPLRLGGGGRLFGIVTTPLDARARRGAAVLVLNPSVLDPQLARDVGSHPLTVSLTRGFASLGFTAFRFDLTGAARVESGPVDRAREAQDAVREAMDKLSETYGPSRFILVGFCLGATLAFRVARSEPRVVGATLVNPVFFYRGDEGQEVLQAAAQLRHYQRLLFDREAWRRVAKGQVDAKKVVALGTHFVRRGLARLRQTRPAMQPEQADLYRDLRGFSERRIDTLLVYTRDELGLDYVRLTLGKRLDELERSGFFKLAIMDGDHAFLRRKSRDILLDLLQRHVAARMQESTP